MTRARERVQALRGGAIHRAGERGRRRRMRVVGLWGFYLLALLLGLLVGRAFAKRGGAQLQPGTYEAELYLLRAR